MPLKPLVIENGIIQPSFGKIKRSRLGGKYLITAGVLTNAGLPVHQSNTTVFEKDFVRPLRINPSETKIEYIDDDVIYFSIPENHFGHALTGTLAYAYILLDSNYKNRKIVFIDKEPNNFIITLLEFLGADRKNIITIREYTKFRSVIVLRQSLRMYFAPILEFIRLFRISKEFIDTFQAIARKFNDSQNLPNKVYFSRKHIINARYVMGEDKIERVFEKNGYSIYYPEQLPLCEQIRLVANADFYACVQGTLEHHSLFMKDGATLIVMSRKTLPTERQVLINKLQTNIKHINIRTNVQPMGNIGGFPKIIGATKRLIDFFDKNNFSYDINELTPTYQELFEYIDRCLVDERKYISNYVRNKIIRLHKSFWKQLK